MQNCNAELKKYLGVSRQNHISQISIKKMSPSIKMKTIRPRKISAIFRSILVDGAKRIKPWIRFWARSAKWTAVRVPSLQPSTKYDSVHNFWNMIGKCHVRFSKYFNKLERYVKTNFHKYFAYYRIFIASINLLFPSKK